MDTPSALSVQIDGVKFTGKITSLRITPNETIATLGFELSTTRYWIVEKTRKYTIQLDNTENLGKVIQSLKLKKSETVEDMWNNPWLTFMPSDVVGPMPVKAFPVK